MFPGSFDRKARDAIITPTTGDANCLEHLVDQSLAEYSYLAKCYAMHSLLCAFSRGSVNKKHLKRKYFRLFATHYTSVLSECIKEAQSGGNISFLYFTIFEDYYNFLHVLNMYLNGTINSLASQADIMTFALDSFDIMQPRFPPHILIEWWSKILCNTCSFIRRDRTSPSLAPQLLMLSTKFGKLLLHHNQISLARSVLEFTNKCVLSITPHLMDQCSHPHHAQYNAMLQILADVYERNEEVQLSLNLRMQVCSCINLQAWNDPDTTLPSVLAQME